MPRAFAINMSHPHERFSLPIPIGRRFPQGIVGWNMLFAFITLVCMILYIVQVNRAATRGFALRDVEKRVEGLHTQVMTLEDKIALLSSVQSMNDQASAHGFVAVDRLEFVSPAGHSYALAK